MTFLLVLKLLSAIFSSNDSHSSIMKNVFLFHLKSFFRSRGIQIFVFPSTPFFLPASQCCKGWLKINLKIYEVIICLNNNLIKHFVWYHEREERYDIETLYIVRVLNKYITLSWKNHAENVHQEVVPDPYFNFGINSHYLQKILLKIKNFERGLSKSLKKVNFIFSVVPSSF